MMPRKKPIFDNFFPYHISARCHNKEWFRLDIDKVWSVTSDYLFFLHHAYEVKIHSFVLMNNHFHLIAHFPEGNISSAMNYFMRETSRVINFESNKINQVYGGPYHKSLITNPLYYLHAYKYVYRNPVEAGLAAKVEDYPLSTLPFKLGKAFSIIPIACDDTLSEDMESTLHWLNTAPDISDKISVTKALSHPVFKIPEKSQDLNVRRY